LPATERVARLFAGKARKLFGPSADDARSTAEDAEERRALTTPVLARRVSSADLCVLRG